MATGPRLMEGYLGAGGFGGVLAGQVAGRGFGDPGGGFELFGGLQFGRWAGLELGWTGSFHDDRWQRRSGLHAVTLDGRFTFLDGRVRPFVFLGVGVFVLNPDLRYHETQAGPVVDAGGGVDFRLSQAFSIGVKVGWRGLFVGNASTLGGGPYERAFVNDVGIGVRLAFHF